MPFVTEEHEIVRSEHGIVRLERDVMIGGALGHFEVRRSPGVGLMAETTLDGALVVHFFFLGSFTFSVVFVFGYLFKDSICIECNSCVYFVLV